LLLGGRALSVESVSVHMNWRVMIKIRYVDPNKISPGLHAAVECHGRTTTVYLLCGLRPEQRRAAFRRLRMSARTGYCPALPAPQLAFARLADRIRTGLGQAGAVFRSHPAATAVPVMLVSAGAVVFLLLPALSARAPQAPGRLAAAPAPVASVSEASAGETQGGASAGEALDAGASDGVPPLPGGSIPAPHAGPASDLLAPASRASRASVGVAAFTSRNSTAP
jgi:hypothetical protein